MGSNVANEQDAAGLADVLFMTMPRPTWPQAYLKPGFFAGLGGLLDPMARPAKAGA